MMTQTQVDVTSNPRDIPSHKQVCPTCEDCPMFNAFEGDERSRGLCKLFDKVVRGYHEATQDCKNNLEEVVVTVESCDQEIGEDEELTPVRTETLSFFLPSDDIHWRSVMDIFNRYSANFPGMFVTQYKRQTIQ